MQRIWATSIGYAARERLQGNENDLGVLGKVHSVFRRAMNIETENGRLLSLSCAGTPNFPSNMVTSLAGGDGFLAMGIAGGALAYCRDGTIVVGGLVCDMRRAVVFYPATRGALPAPNRGSLGGQLTEVATANWVGESAKGESLGFASLLPYLVAKAPSEAPAPPLADIFVKTAWPLVARLIPVLGEPEKFAEMGAALVGLGPGLTPAGDDLLAGLMASYHFGYLATGRGVAPLLECFRPILQRAEVATNGLSREMLHFAARGEMNEVAEQVVVAFLGGDAHAQRESTERLVEYGASSGLDQLAGIILGLRGSLELGCFLVESEGGQAK
ncbi:MAG: hypothetical protein DDT36_01735 [Firmicutes bacterium]|nr:hypothetical protein [Bacillota bacterium]